jgi:hypothetical protein
MLTMDTTGLKLNDLVVREPASGEIQRAMYLFKNLPPPKEAHLFVVGRTQPIPRLAAAGAAWLQGKTALFRIACQPGISRSTVASLLMERLEKWGSSHGAELFRFADLLPDDDEWCPFLKNGGFYPLRSERFFQVSYDHAYRRVMALVNRCQTDIPKAWRTEMIRNHSPGMVVNLVTQHRLLPVAELQQYWRADMPFGFDIDMSCILFDDQEVIGTLLIRRGYNVFVLDVRVVTCQNPYLRALGNICLFHHVAKRVAPGGSIQWLEFRGGEMEHVETANLAIRMGGREMAERRVWGKKL